MYDFIRNNQLDIMLALSSACMVFALMLVVTRFLNRIRKTILLFMELIATFLLFFDRMAYIYSGDVSHKGFVMVRMANFMVFFLTSAIILGFNLYLIDLITVEGRSDKIPVRLKVVTTGAVLGMALVVISQFTGFIYYIDDLNVYHRGPGFLTAYLIPVVCPIIQYTVIRRLKRVVSSLVYISLVFYIFVPIIVGVIQIFTYGISIVNMSMVLVSISLYIFTYLDINETVIKAHRIEMEGLEEEKKSIKRLFDQTANAFVAAMEKRDTYSDGHSARVAALAKRIAQRAGKNEEECDEVYYAGLLHDVGMMGIPDYLLNKTDGLTPEEEKLIKNKPLIGEDILSNIREYPYLKDGALYLHERYDGTGYPDGIKGKEIPELSRIINIADAYDTMAVGKKNREPEPYQTVREEFITGSGNQFDPAYTEIMINIMDEELGLGKDEEPAPVESELECAEYRSAISQGIPVTGEVTVIRFRVKDSAKERSVHSAPSIILFDSYDRRVHDNPKAILAYHYQEYGEVWFDGNFVSTDARKMETAVVPQNSHGEEGVYEIIAGRVDDHVSVKMTAPDAAVSVVMALEDKSKASYIGITGENCSIYGLTVEKTGDMVKKGDIKRIADEISYIERMEADIPNVQIDSFRSGATEGIAIKEYLKIDFHTMSLPSSSLIWHCPQVVLFYSEDGRVYGEGYKEYELIKINGEADGDNDEATNSFTIKKQDSFPGWDTWKAANKEGMECSVIFERKRNKVVTTTSNMGIDIVNTTVVKDGAKEIYAALTGDQVALTDIRIDSE